MVTTVLEHISYASKLVKEKNLAQAIIICDELLKRNLELKDKIHVLQIQGLAYYMDGKVQKSIECFKNILQLDPKNIDAAICLSVAYNDIGLYEEAKNIYKIANQSLYLKKPGSDKLLDSRFSLKHIELGDLYFKFHRYDEALQEYSKALLLDPTHLQIRIKIAKVYARKGFTSRALQELQTLAYENPDFLEARIQLGLLHYSTGNIIDAQIEWERVLKEDPNNIEVFQYLEMAKQSSTSTNE
jgi:tetratricopeptide (TPR) repeat protein